MELTEKSRLFLPRTVSWQREGSCLFLDPEQPHWIATDPRGAQIIGWLHQGLPFGEIVRRTGSSHGLGAGKAWLHIHDFVSALLRCGFARTEPRVPAPYQGRAAYARPAGLKELWFHTNNVCNLSCRHCLVSSAPWVQDWGLPTERFLALIDEAAALGVERFYFTGGEPFMRRDIFRLIRAITEEKGRELILLTNATLLKGEKAQGLEALDRERVRFQVSVDGATAATNDPIRGKGSFTAAVEGLRFLASLGFQTSVTTVVTGSNLAELPGVTLLAHDLGVPTQHLMWMHKRGRIAGQEEQAPPAAGNGRDPAPARLDFPTVERLIEAVRKVKEVAHRLGVAVDNLESIKQRVNSRPGVKYDLGNACWDSLCVY